MTHDVNRPTGDWLESLALAIDQLDAQLKQMPDSPQLGDESVRLRLMQLASGNRQAVASPPKGVDPRLSSFWTSELGALDTMLEANEAEHAEASWAEARRQLRIASDSLAEAMPLEVRGLAFCRAVRGYGSIERFEKYAFEPGQRVLLYAEIENFKFEQASGEYHTLLRSSYQIIDDTGKEAARQEATTTEDSCLNPRRDYFIGCDFRLPEAVRPGRYTLKLTVEDLKSGKRGEASIEFSVR